MSAIKEKVDWDFVIVGGGIAGFSAADTISQNLPDASVLILSEEDRLPYRRTKISKTIAAGSLLARADSRHRVRPCLPHAGIGDSK